MRSVPDSITVPLAAYLDEEEGESSLRAAAQVAGQAAFDLAALFDWLHGYRADTQRKDRAEVVLRAALRLPLVPGPVCRSPNYIVGPQID